LPSRDVSRDDAPGANDGVFPDRYSGQNDTSTSYLCATADPWVSQGAAGQFVVEGNDPRADENVVLDNHAARNVAGRLDRNAIADPALADIAMRANRGASADYRAPVNQGKRADTRAGANEYASLNLGESRVIEMNFREALL
jgi:hypothetical protein